MQVERLLAFAEDASMAALCDVWDMRADDVADSKNGKRPVSTNVAGALSEIRRVTVCDLGNMAMLAGCFASGLIEGFGPLLAP